MGDVYIMSQVSHPNLLALLAFSLSPPRMVLEFAAGGDLETLFNPHRLAGYGPSYDSLERRCLPGHENARRITSCHSVCHTERLRGGNESVHHTGNLHPHT